LPGCEKGAAKGAAMNFWRDFNQGLVKENPVLRLMIGLCPVLAVSNNATNALGMSVAVAFVLICSNLVIALIRKITPDEIRIPIFIIVISTFVTICDYAMQAYTPALYQSLGVFVPLIVVNCIILGRAEAFAFKNPVLNSVLDGVGMSLGFALALVSIGVIREILGAGSIFNLQLYNPAVAATIMILPPGAFLTIGGLMAALNKLENKVQ
jgi:electron transport complex protein RnfE